MAEVINILKGGKYTLDLGHANCGTVEIVSILNECFVLVKDISDGFEYEWEVHIKLLSETKNKRHG